MRASKGRRAWAWANSQGDDMDIPPGGYEDGITLTYAILTGNSKAGRRGVRGVVWCVRCGDAEMPDARPGRRLFEAAERQFAGMA